MSSAPESAELEALIRRLGAPEAEDRERAAGEIFRRGQASARSPVTQWLSDPEFAANLVFDSSQFPETTVGVAVRQETFDRIRAANGSPRLAHVPPDQDAKEFELHFAQSIRLDILTSRAPEEAGAIARYLQKFGEGVQQVELLTRNIDRATEILRSRFALQPIYPATRAGADGTRVNFFLAASPEKGKILIELVELGAAAPNG